MFSNSITTGVTNPNRGDLSNPNRMQAEVMIFECELWRHLYLSASPDRLLQWINLLHKLPVTIPYVTLLAIPILILFLQRLNISCMVFLISVYLGLGLIQNEIVKFRYYRILSQILLTLKTISVSLSTCACIGNTLSHTWSILHWLYRNVPQSMSSVSTPKLRNVPLPFRWPSG